MEDREARIALNAVVEPGDIEAARLVRDHGAVDVWKALLKGTPQRWAARARHFLLEDALRLAHKHAIRFLAPGDAQWPSMLDDLDFADPLAGRGGAPLGLWVRGPGAATTLTARSVAIVGSRAATAYGQTVASDMSAEIGAAGVTVVSGGAYGIDAAAHRGALAANARTVAVLAGGLDNLHPAGNALLLGEICESHLVISEVPPGGHPTRVGFLARNRLIAALSSATIVVEAASRSGARNTASWATRLGRHVLAVPGSVHSAASVTPNRLIRDGQAVLVTSSEDVLDDLGLADHPDTLIPLDPAACRPWDTLGDPTRSVLDAFPGRGTITVAELSVAAGLGYRSTLDALGELVDVGLVEMTAEGDFRLTRGRPPAASTP